MKTKIAFLVMVAGGIVLFQNCSVSTMHSEAGAFDASSLMNTSDLSWTIRAQKGVTVTRLSQASRWTDRTGGSVSLFPPLMPNSTQPDMSKAPYVKVTDSGPLMNFSPASYLTPQVGDANLFTGDAYSVVLYVRNLSFPQTAFPRQVRLFEMIPEETGEASGWIGIDMYELDDGQIQINAFQYYGANLATVAYIKLPASSATSGFGIAARFAADPNQVFMSVNGVTSEIQVVGVPPVMANTSRRLYLHTKFQSEGSYDMAEFGIWKREFGIPEALYFSKAIKEVIEFGGTGLFNPGHPTVSREFAQIQVHLTTCMACHSVGNSAQVKGNMGVKVNSAVPWVVPGDSANSLMIKSLRHQAGSSAMPKDLNALSAASIDALAGWIDRGAL